LIISNLKAGADTRAIIEHPLVFDLRDVNYISSSFIRICVNTAKQIQKGKFSIIHCDPFIKKTFKIAGLDDLLNIS
jgi:anti-anti-sigma factor